jgi:hypothetical protein
MTPTEIVEQYFTLSTDADTERFVAQFRDDAVVVDDGHTRRGRAELRAWRREVPAVTYTVGAIAAADQGARADVEIAGDFPGSPVTLDFAFGLDADGLIESLMIQPAPR